MNHKIKEELERIKIPKNLYEKSKMGVRRAKLARPKSKIKKLLIPLVASTFFVFTGVGAAYVPSLNHLVGLVSPQVAVMLQPIEMSSEDNGIKMEVIAAMNDDEMAVIYVTLQDLTGDRIDETLDLYDYSFTGARIMTSEIVNFDETTNTATLRIQGNGGQKLNGKKMNVSIDSFLSNKETFESAIDIDIPSLLNMASKTVQIDMNHIPGGGGLLLEELWKNDFLQVLKPNETEMKLPEIPWVDISNVGIIDNRLHIQVKWDEENLYDHGYFFFKDDFGNEIHSSSVVFDINESGQTEYGRRYTEYIFDLKEINLDEQSLFAQFIRNGNYIKGNWNNTFKMTAVLEEISDSLNKSFGTWTANHISLSPLGVTLTGNGEMNNDDIEMKVKRFDGAVQNLDATTTLNDSNQVIMKFIADLPLAIEEIQSVMIDGEEINIK